MGPKPPEGSDSADLYRNRLGTMLDRRHELVRLAGLIDWDGFHTAFARFYRLLGRPAKPTRLMVIARELFDRFQAMIRQRKAADLSSWLEDASSSLLASSQTDYGPTSARSPPRSRRALVKRTDRRTDLGRKAIAHGFGLRLAEDEHLFVAALQFLLPSNQPILSPLERGDSGAEVLAM